MPPPRIGLSVPSVRVSRAERGAVAYDHSVEVQRPGGEDAAAALIGRGTAVSKRESLEG